MRLDTVLLLAVLATPAASLAAPATVAAPTGVVRTDRGVRFAFPAGYQVTQRAEHEAGEEDDQVYVGVQGRVEIRVEVEKGAVVCTGQALAGEPRTSTTAGRASCEVELAAPPSLDAGMGERRAASVLVQFPGRFLSVVVFAPDQASATRLARQVAATAVEEK